KVEFEAMEEGREEAIMTRLFENAVRTVFDQFTQPEDMDMLALQFAEGLTVTTGESLPAKDYAPIIQKIEGMDQAVQRLVKSDSPAQRASAVEFILEGLHIHQLLNKDRVTGRTTYRG
ncbi:MAG: magnesium chelatase, partial [Gammaproteobacteria bacterium]|nr:magnesium chelatase [Gammaproteobacteria bacterium]